MKLKSAMKIIMRKRMTQTEMGKRLGINQTGVSQRIVRGESVSVGNLLEMLDVLDFELVIQPRHHFGTRPEMQIVIGKEK